MITRFNFIEKLLLRFNVLPEPLMDAALITTGRALISAVKLGLIDELEQNPKTAAEVAHNTGICERGGKSPLSKLITSHMALNLLQQTGGNTYTYPEVKAWLQQAGFQDVKLKKLQAPGFGLVIGRK